jgi:hypothetical protein
MPALAFRVAATDSDALSNLKFAVVPARGAILNLWASCVTKTDSFGISIGDRDLMVNGSIMNIEIAADVVDTDRDQRLFNEVLVSGGQLFMPVTVTTEAQFLITLRYG